MSKNKVYEDKQKEKGLVKRTYWVPIQCETEVMQIIEFCRENKDYCPFMVRNYKTGKMAKGI